MTDCDWLPIIFTWIYHFSFTTHTLPHHNCGKKLWIILCSYTFSYFDPLCWKTFIFMMHVWGHFQMTVMSLSLFAWLVRWQAFHHSHHLLVWGIGWGKWNLEGKQTKVNTWGYSKCHKHNATRRCNIMSETSMVPFQIGRNWNFTM